MAWLDVLSGYQTWSDFITSSEEQAGIRNALREQTRDISATTATRVRLTALSLADLRATTASGFGALGNIVTDEVGALGDRLVDEIGGLDATMFDGFSQLTDALELGFDRLGGGIEKLNADFNLLLGDVIWQMRLQQGTLDAILKEIRLPEFEREARALRERAEDAFRNGWYEESLIDFQGAADRNYRDFSVHRSIATIRFYHCIDLPTALKHYLLAAKYSEPSDRTNSAECYFFAGLVALANQQRADGERHLIRALALNPRLFEAHYQLAVNYALAPDVSRAWQHTESAISGDSRYFERARHDRAFLRVREDVNHRLSSLYERVLSECRGLEKFVKAARTGRAHRNPEFVTELDRALDAAAAVHAPKLAFAVAVNARDLLAKAHDVAQRRESSPYSELWRLEWVNFAFAPDGDRIASVPTLYGSTSPAYPEIRSIWTGQGERTLGPFRGGGKDPFIWALEWLPAPAKVLVLATDNHGRQAVLGWIDAKSGKVVRPYECKESVGYAQAALQCTEYTDVQGYHVNSISAHRMWLSATANMVALDAEIYNSGVAKNKYRSGTRRGVVCIDLSSQELWIALVGHKVGTFTCGFSPDGRTLYFGQGDDTGKPGCGRIHRFDLLEECELDSIDAFGGSVRSLAIAEGPDLVAATGLDTYPQHVQSGAATPQLCSWLKLWERSSGILIASLGEGYDNSQVAFRPGTWELAVSKGEEIEIWDTRRVEKRTIIPQTFLPEGDFVRIMQYSPTGDVLVVRGWMYTIALETDPLTREEALASSQFQAQTAQDRAAIAAAFAKRREVKKPPRDEEMRERHFDAQRRQWRAQGRCSRCGGELGLFHRMRGSDVCGACRSSRR